MTRALIKPLLAAAALTCAVSSQAAQNDVVRIGIEGAYPPFSSVDSKGNLYGFDVDIAKALCNQMKAKCQFVSQEWDGIIPALIARKFDAIISSMADTEERRKQVDFSNAYYHTTIAVAVSKDADIKDISPESMKGHAIGAQSSSTQGMYAEDVYGKAGADVHLYPTPDEAGADLIAGRLDAIVHDKFPLREWMEKHSEDCCRMLGEIKETESPISVAVRKGDKKLAERFNKAIDAIRADGTYQKISIKYFGTDIY
ncbi:MAG: transporter substrate-binding domain-containing protein [Lautropia sp.]|nr:transporter substrate-binding domain-containing protein [Lautropia sp.]